MIFSPGKEKKIFDSELVILLLKQIELPIIRTFSTLEDSVWTFRPEVTRFFSNIFQSKGIKYNNTADLLVANASLLSPSPSSDFNSHDIIRQNLMLITVNRFFLFFILNYTQCYITVWNQKPFLSIVFYLIGSYITPSIPCLLLNWWNYPACLIWLYATQSGDFPLSTCASWLTYPTPTLQSWILTCLVTLIERF